MIIYTTFVFLLHEITWISYVICEYMKWNPKQHPSMHYDANTQNRRRNSDIIILIFPSTETSDLDDTVAYDERKT